MSQLRVNSITSVNGTDPISFPSGFSGNASLITFPPKIVSFSPLSLGTSVNIDTNINITFDQTIQFSGSGTITLRTGSSTGTIVESYVCGSSARLSISGQTLVIDPTNNLDYNTTYFVVLPSAGIANTSGQFFAGSNTYTFTTVSSAFLISGGTYTFDQATPTSPTGYYRYHIFSGTSPFTLSSPSLNATDLTLMIIGGGGGGGNYPNRYGAGGGGGAGGLITRNGPTWALPSGTYVMTVGAGGQGSTGSQPTNTNGGDTTITPPTSPTTFQLRAFGGGAGGYPAYNPTFSDYSGNPGGSGGGAYSNAPTTITGAGTPGQGNPGGYRLASNIPSGYYIVAAGGGGAGGVGGNATSGSPTGPFRAGNGGPGLAVPQFPGTIFSSGNIPLPVMPLDTINRTNGTFAGGGGGGMSANYGPSYSGQTGGGGPGGGGHGSSYNPTQGPTTFPGPFGGPPSNWAQSGAALSGGGGGGGYYGPTNSYSGGNGGSGVAMIRYAIPSSLL